MEERGQIRAKREAAQRARRLTMELALEEDRRRLLAFAAELDAQADALEQSLVAPPLKATQVQMQVQQEQGPSSKKEDDKGRS